MLIDYVHCVWLYVAEKEAELMATLKDAKIGATVKVKKIHGEGAIKRRIMDMGLTKGVEVYVRKVSFLIALFVII